MTCLKSKQKKGDWMGGWPQSAFDEDFEGLGSVCLHRGFWGKVIPQSNFSNDTGSQKEAVFVGLISGMRHHRFHW